MNSKNRKAMETTEPDHALIEALAYELWQSRGCPEGSPETDWMLAEETLREDPEIARLLAA